MAELAFPHIQYQSPQGSVSVPGFRLAQMYLEQRGVTEELIESCGLVITTAQFVFSELYGGDSSDDRVAVVFPHYTTRGTAIDWWSARLVETGLRPAPKGFAALTQKKRGKMACPPNTAPHAYLPPILDWSTIPKGTKIYIHESCIKALNGAARGYYSVGLNGVFGWSSKKNDVSLVEELRWLPWKQRELIPVIVFDSNAEDNWDVQQAIAGLASRLWTICGVAARHLLLPRHPGTSEHWGFDDACVELGDAWVVDFLEEDGKEVLIDEIEMLKAQLNKEVCVVRSMQMVAEVATGTIMSKGGFTDINFATYHVQVDDGEKLKTVNVPKLWMVDPKRTEVEALEYLPGQDLIVGDRLNLWRGMGLEPAEGDVAPWLDLLANNVADASLRHYILSWLAWPLQNPGAKLNTYLHIFGPSGTGKGRFVAPFMRIYGGDNAVLIGQENLESSFNSIYAGKQLVHADELKMGKGPERDKLAQKIKLLTTSDTLTVNKKGIPEYTISNTINFISTSNYYDSVKLDEDDRRACVVRWDPSNFGVDRRHDEEYWTEYSGWLDAGGAAAVMDYLLKYDCTGFNPRGWAPENAEKEQVKDAGRTPMERWLLDLVEAPDDVLPINLVGRRIFTSRELAVLYFGEAELKKGQIDSLSMVMKNVGIHRMREGKLIKVSGVANRYWTLDEAYIEADTGVIQKHLGVVGVS